MSCGQDQESEDDINSVHTFPFSFSSAYANEMKPAPVHNRAAQNPSNAPANTVPLAYQQGLLCIAVLTEQRKCFVNPHAIRPE